MLMEPEVNLPTEEELSDLPSEAIVVYATRCALRTFPMIGHSGSFLWQQSEGAKYLASIEASFFAIILAPLLETKVAINYFNATETAVAAAFGAAYGAAHTAAAKVNDTNAAKTAFAAAQGYGVTIGAANVYTIDVDEVRISYAASVADTAFATAVNPAATADAIQSDFVWLKEHSVGQKLAFFEPFYRRPLWDEKVIGQMGKVFGQFQKALVTVSRPDIWQWYETFLYGRPIDTGLLSARLEVWYSRHTAEKAAVSKTPSNPERF